MKELINDKFIDDALRTAPRVDIPEDLHFDAAEIMRLSALRPAPEGGGRRAAPKSVKAMPWTRFGAVAAAFAVLLGAGAYGLSLFSAKEAADAWAPSPGSRYGENAEYAEDAAALYAQQESAKSGKQEVPAPMCAEATEARAEEQDSGEALLAEALSDEGFRASFEERDSGFGYVILSAEDVPEGVSFMIYFYKDREEAALNAAGEGEADCILWAR